MGVGWGQEVLVGGVGVVWRDQSAVVVMGEVWYGMVWQGCVGEVVCLG